MIWGFIQSIWHIWKKVELNSANFGIVASIGSRLGGDEWIEFEINIMLPLMSSCTKAESELCINHKNLSY